MRTLVHGSTFSGIGGPEVAAAMLGWENAFHCEINEFGRTILDYYFPNAESYDDITKTDFSKWRGRIDVLTGGFPCQPFSYAGKRKGAEDDRYLWPYMFKCIEQIRPTWFVGENVAGIATMVFPSEDVEVASQATLFGEGDTYTTTKQRYVIEEICRNLESIGYSVQPMLIPACAVGTPHRRDRIFFIAHNERDAIADTNSSNDGSGTTGEDASKSGEERIQERNAVWESIKSDHVRPKGERVFDNTIPQNTLHSRQLYECDEEQGRERNIWNIGSRSSERICNRTQRIADIEGILPENRWRNFPTVSPILRGDDGLPFTMDDLTISPSKWRTESLKAYGNAIVPQVMYEIFLAIEQIENN